MDNLLLITIKDALLEAKISEDMAIKSLRAFCRKYGGQKIYFSQSPNSKRSLEIFNLVSEAISCDKSKDNDDFFLSHVESDAEKITKIFLECFYNISEYVPLEINAFRKEVALEINKEYIEAKNKHEKKLEICQRLNISFVTFIKLRKIANESKQSSECFNF